MRKPLRSRFVMQHFKACKTGRAGTWGAITAMPLAVIALAASDAYSLYSFRAQLQQSAEEAALAATQLPKASLLQREAAALSAFQKSWAETVSLSRPRIQVMGEGREAQVEASVEADYRLRPWLGLAPAKIAASARIKVPVYHIEVALALDVTGSMQADMETVQAAGRIFTQTLFDKVEPGTLQMALVPYAASVNPGASGWPLSMIDTDGRSLWHGQALKGRAVARLAGCTLPSASTVPDPETTGSIFGNPGPRGKDRRSENGSGLKHFAATLFGITSASAAESAASRPGSAGHFITTRQADARGSLKAFVPAGFQVDAPCLLTNPVRVNHLDLFARIPKVRWKGCVEARPEPFDVNDEAPDSSKPNTLFVPYFAPDEPDEAQNASYANSYIPDGSVPVGWEKGNDAERFANLLKYDNASPAKLQEGQGPNYACPDEMQRLTQDPHILLNRIDSLKTVSGGGTIASEGVMWGWRALSPKAPFADGLGYGDARKVIVLVSDGLNSLAENNRFGPLMSDYSAYGYLKGGRFPKERFDAAEVFLDGRLKTACANAKASGIQIYTILLRERDDTARRLLRDCASSPFEAYAAEDAIQLSQVMLEIAGRIGQSPKTQ